MSKVEALTASASRTGIVHDHSGYTIPAPSPAAPVAAMRPPPVMAQYKAKVFFKSQQNYNINF